MGDGEQVVAVIPEQARKTMVLRVEKRAVCIPSRTSRWFACRYRRTGRSSDRSVSGQRRVMKCPALRRGTTSSTWTSWTRETHGGRLAGVDVAIVKVSGMRIDGGDDGMMVRTPRVDVSERFMEASGSGGI